MLQKRKVRRFPKHSASSILIKFQQTNAEINCQRSIFLSTGLPMKINFTLVFQTSSYAHSQMRHHLLILMHAGLHLHRMRITLDKPLLFVNAHIIPTTRLS